VPVDSLSPDPANVRRHPERNLDTIKASLRRFGQQKPIVVDAKGIVRAGNGTLEAAKALGWDKIAVVRSDLAGSEATAFAIADNRSAELAEWDGTALAEQLRSLQSEDFDLEAVGYDDDEIAALIDGLAGDLAGPGDPAAPNASLAERFGVPPFSVLDARQGYWQDRKRAWLALGIQSELGRGGAPGGSPRPAARLTDKGHTARGDGRGRAYN
jgi:ParB-like chromosome segregation protein Spo0J